MPNDKQTKQKEENSMKQIILKSLTMEGFRGEQMRTTEFNEGETLITGANGTGKSRHFDAFVWLLFGKDTEGRKDYNVKTMVNGEPIARAKCTVSGILEVDGEAVELTRIFGEEWVKPRGSDAEVFKGNKTECYWNGAPISVSEYQERVEALLGETLFKLLTNPLYFFSLPWKEQREQLTALVPELSNEEIAERDETLKAFIETLSKKPLADFKRELSARKRKLRNDLAEISPRIDQTRVMMPQARDWDALEAEADRIDGKLGTLDELLAKAHDRIQVRRNAVKAQTDRLEALLERSDDMLLSARTEARRKASEANRAREEAEESIAQTKRTCDRHREAARRMLLEKEEHNARAAALGKEADTLRNKWYATNERIYNGETTCPQCGQPLPKETIAEAEALFLKHKKEELDTITATGKKLRERISTEEAEAARLRSEADAETEKANELRQQIQEAEERLAQMPEAVNPKTEPEELFSAEQLADWHKLKEEIEKAREAMNQKDETVTTDSSDAYQKERMDLIAERDRVREQLADRKRIEEGERQIKTLEDSGRDISQRLAEAERDEMTMRHFQQLKTEACATRINALFDTLSFKLFTYTQEDKEKDNPIETCEPLVRGVPFGVANTAARTQAGMELIRVLSKHYNICAPIFIDNRESINRIPESDAQIISLKVTEEKELTIK